MLARRLVESSGVLYATRRLTRCVRSRGYHAVAVGRLLFNGGAFLVVAAIATAGGVTRAQSNASAPTARPLVAAFVDPVRFPGQERRAAFIRSRAAGATVVRLILSWSTVAPAGNDPPAAFDARNPGDPLYRWEDFDDEVSAAVTAGLQPVVDIHAAPNWAQMDTCAGPGHGACRPSPTALADFATAAARRYGGGYQALPRVNRWMVWNEPNLSIELRPQFVGSLPASADWYRSMVNAMGSAVKAVRRDNVVVAGGLAPFGGDTNDPSGGTVNDQERVRPMEFMRRLLCMSGGAKPRATCNHKTAFDVWAHHPYTYGGPTHKAFHRDDVSLGDLDKMTTLLNAAERVGHIRSRSKVGFWVTEFSYDSQPADPEGLPPALHARWVSEALYRMWSDGVSLVTWFLVSDLPFPQEMFQSGLYTKDNRPKLALRAFRFPFVAFWEKSGAISYWGRTPAGVKKSVVVEQKAGARWRRVVVPSVDRYGIFSGRIEDVRGSGSLRARLARGADFSQPFSLTVPKDFRFCPWGSFC